ncbi:MAG: hypothetical protein KJN72_05810 [Woeseia sp.]|nr:hypothetical protein [Woeseia sp.]
MINTILRTRANLIAAIMLTLCAAPAFAGDGLSKADKYFEKAAQYEAQGDHEKAAKYRAKAERYAGDEHQSKTDKYAAKAAYYAEQGDMDKAQKYAAKARKYADEQNDSKAAKYAAKAEKYALEGKLDKAAKYANKAREAADKYGASCLSQIETSFSTDSMSASVESSKDLSNVVLLFSDGTTERQEEFDGPSATVSATGGNVGKILTGIWVKSGCNHSDDGPGYGEFFENTVTTTGLPVVSISGNPRTVELHQGDITEAIFTISLSEMVPLDCGTVTVVLTTRNGTASAGSDFVAEHTTLTFMPGDISLEYAIRITGDSINEGRDENYFVDLSTPGNAVLGHSTAEGVILEDDCDN